MLQLCIFIGPGGNATDCFDIKQQNPSAVSGVYSITTRRTHTILMVYCDMDTDGGGWTVCLPGLNVCSWYPGTFTYMKSRP